MAKYDKPKDIEGLRKSLREAKADAEAGGADPEQTKAMGLLAKRIVDIYKLELKYAKLRAENPNFPCIPFLEGGAEQ